ncbi:VOC family protein [Conyzicola nivalis]|uniref:Glyoxalase/bleomycin resistance protein n=1 Tax=Conyzicola nivalis TaxID=1477021 RepID=A0A916SI02_9MICO|nr:VOC family protein [Conyzicola nivalis]GGB00031.1 putative glyoxalase/bleomycin resistance protein [Conyzicola nivalis]
MPLTFRPGQPRWMDLLSRHPEKSVEFYRGLLGWETETAPAEFGGYVTFSKDGQNVSGLMPNPADSGVDDIWTVYLEVADARATGDAAEAEGGRVLELEQLADMGTWLVITDPGGARVGGWQNLTHSGFEVTTGPGAPVWAELHARDYARAVSFYRTVFGWETEVLSDTDEMRYTTLGSGADAVAGIWDADDLPEIEPPFWDVYLGVENANEAAVRVTELGGTMLERVQDSPYGRQAHAVDPTGAKFAILQVD